MKDNNPGKPLNETATSAQRLTSSGTLRWEDFVWLLILSGLATLWIMLLMSPSWR